VSVTQPPAAPTQAVVVTGASGGIGAAIARRLGRAGYVVVLQYASHRARAQSLASEIDSGGSRCHVVGADLSHNPGVTEFVDRIDHFLDEHPGVQLWGLVNNAAFLLGPSFREATPDQFDRFFAMNVRAPFFLSQHLAERMTSGGSIVNISSVGAHFSSPGDIVYAMSKAALESFTANAAEALAPHGIRINTVIPGFTDNGHPLLDEPEIRDYVSSFAVLGGIADPATVAEAVAFLISERASRTTGAALDVSGGSALGARRSHAPQVSLKQTSDALTDLSARGA